MGYGELELASWRAKAVKDDIVESWLCVDCGMNTHPGCPDGPRIRIDIALYGKSAFRFDRETEVYTVRNSIWKEARMAGWGGCLCVGCIERRLGRQLRPKDFHKHDRAWSEFPCTERLLNRRGFATVTVQTQDGPKEMICGLEQAKQIEGCFMEEAVGRHETHAAHAS
jgi:hypothetical protein